MWPRGRAWTLERGLTSRLACGEAGKPPLRLTCRLAKAELRPALEERFKGLEGLNFNC